MNRTFLHLLTNTLLVSVVNFTVWFAITFFVYLETRSVFATGIISGVFLTFTAASGVWFGSLVDHHPKRTVMIASTVTSLACYLAALGIYLTAGDGAFADPGSPVLWAMVLTLMVGVIVGNVRGIALSTTVTMLFAEGRRDRANGMIGSTSGVSFLVTSVISGVLVGLSGMLYVLLLAVVVMAGAALHLAAIRIPGDRAVAGTDGPRRVDLRGTIAVITAMPGLVALIAFTTINNLLGGVVMALMDPYGLSLVSVEAWGLLWGVLSTALIIGGLLVAKRGLGTHPLRAMLLANVAIWVLSTLSTVQPSILLLAVGMFGYLLMIPFIEAAEQTVLQKVVPLDRQGRVFGFAQSVEQAASPLTAFLISPVAQFVFMPFMTTGAGAELLGPWFGTGPDRGIALLFVIAGLLGTVLTLVAFRTRQYRALTRHYAEPAQLVGASR